MSPFPAPPRELLDAALPVRGAGLVAPAPDVEAWIQSEILAPDRPLSNYDHQHLLDGQAHVGVLWTTETLVKQGRRILGRCALGPPTGDAWAQAFRREQLVRWFGGVPDFVVTLDALFVDHALRTGRPADVLALVEHELYHAGQERDPYGAPRFTRDGDPVWGVRPHDVEEFAGVVRRYGIGASAAGPLAEAIDYVREHGPDVAQATLDGACACGAPIGAPA